MDTYFNWDRKRTVKALARALLVPWIFWSLVYGVLNIIQHKPFFIGGVSTIMYGTSVHLWFLPFIFVVLSVLNVLKRYSPVILFRSATFLATGLLLTVSIWRPLSVDWPQPFPQWIHALTPVLIGIVLGLKDKMGREWLLGLLVIAVAVFIGDLALLPGIALPYTFGILVTALVTFLGSDLMPPSWNVQPVASCMLGVYLCHIVVLKLATALTGPANYLTVVLAFTLTVFGVWAVRRFVPLSRIVLG